MQLINSLQEKLTSFSHKSFLFFFTTGLIVSALWLMGDSTLDSLMYHRDSVANGEFWRFITAHFVHSNGWHLLLNLASLLLVGLLFCHHLSIRAWSILFISSALMISATYFWIAPEFKSYVGLSAVLYGVIIVGALLDLKNEPFIATVVLLIVTGRVIWQQFFGSVEELATLINERVAIESHLFGIISGYLQGIFLLWQQKQKSTQQISD